MTQHVDAIYEDGVLKPLKPLNLSEHERVRVSVVSQVQGPSQFVDAQRRYFEELDVELAGIPDDRILYERPT